MIMGVAQYRSAYRSGRLDPETVVADHIAYAKEVQGKVNAISEINPSAIEEARMSARRYAAGAPLGPFDGIPVVVKDSYCVTGMRRWHGSAIHDGDPVSEFDSEPIARLKESGAIVIAKTTMPDMGMLASGLSSQFGIVRNPWNTAMSPGGSSAGAGASLAMGLGAVGLGTDIAGSVRLPAGHCGLAGIKPTQGRIAYSPASTMRSSGVLGRTVSDVIEGLMVVGRQAGSDPYCLPGSFTPVAFETVLQRMPRVGILLDMGYGIEPEPQVAAAVVDAAKRLERAGFDVRSVALDLTEADFANADMVFKAHAVSEIRASRHPDSVLPEVARWCEGAEGISMADYNDALDGLIATVSRIEKATDGCDFLICPTIPFLGFPAGTPGPGDDRMPLHHTQFTAWFNQTGQPAAVYREAQDASTGLPVDVQIVGRRFDDAGVLAVARYLEGTRGEVPAFPVIEEEVPDYEL